MRFDELDELAREWRQTGTEPAGVGPLSTGEAIYVALAANQVPAGYSIASALSRLGEEWTQELIERHRYG